MADILAIDLAWETINVLGELSRAALEELELACSNFGRKLRGARQQFCSSAGRRRAAAEYDRLRSLQKDAERQLVCGTSNYFRRWSTQGNQAWKLSRHSA
jgi:hypothetical protein